MTVTSHLSTDGGFVLAENQELEMFEHSDAGHMSRLGWDGVTIRTFTFAYQLIPPFVVIRSTK